MKYDCTKTLDYDHEVNRMCKTIPTSPIGKCPNCPLANIGGCSPASGLIQRTIDIVQKWSDEHPEKPKLTKKEHEFLATFLISIDKAVVRGKLMQDLYIHDTRHDAYCAIDPTMFSFIQEEERMTFDELLKLEVEE